MIVTDTNSFKTFSDARTFCQGQGGYLATVTTPEQFSILAATGEALSVKNQILNVAENQDKKTMGMHANCL